MAELALELDQGRNSGTDPKRVPAGFTDDCVNWVYSHEDPSRLHVIPGRTLAGSLSGISGVTAANTDGIAYARYDQGADQILLQANDRLFETPAATTLGSWTEVKDHKTPKVAYPRTGSFIKVIQDPLRRNIVFSGANEQPLVRDADGNWKFLSLRPPAASALSVLPASGGSTLLRPDANAVPGTTSEGPATASFDSTTFPVAQAYDTGSGAPDTYTQKVMRSAGILAHDFTFASATGVARTLTVRFHVSAYISANPRSEDPVDAIVLLQTDIGGAGFQTFYSRNVGNEILEAQVNLTSANPNTVTFRFIVHYRTASLYTVIARLHDIRLIETNAAPNTALDVARGLSTNITKVHYVTTEAYSVTLSNGRTIFVESAPSDLAVVATTGATGIGATITTDSAIKLTLPPQENYRDEGRQIPTAKAFLFRRIYRSVDGGVYPNLGLIADQIPIDATTFIDSFSVHPDTLGTPGVGAVYVGEAIYPLASPAPPWRDATNYRGSIVCIPLDNPHSIRWTPPGFPDYFPVVHEFSFFTGDRNNEGKGVTSIGDTLILFLRNGVYRIRNLSMATGGPEFSPIDQMSLTELSPSEGLAGSPLGYCKFNTQRGHTVVAWISDSGIWMTDGSLPSERGMGITRLTENMNWDKDIDLTRLQEAQLTFDPVMQVIYFDAFNPQGDAVTYYLHTSLRHWARSGADQLVPKFTGPHTLTASHSGRILGDNGTNILHWVLDKTGLRLLNERTGTDNVGSEIRSVLRTHWVYPTGARRGFQIYAGEVYHSDWGANEACDLEIQTRRDVTGVIQSSHKKGVSLAGERLTPLPFLQGSGQSLRVILQRTGSTTSSGTPLRAIGPVVIEIEPVDEFRKD